MKLYVLLILFFANVTAIEEMNSIVIGSVVHTFIPRTRLTWTAQLDDGQIVSASSCYARKPRKIRGEDLLKVRYAGRIGKKRMNEGEAKQWMKKLIKASIVQKKG